MIRFDGMALDGAS